MFPTSEAFFFSLTLSKKIQLHFRENSCREPEKPRYFATMFNAFFVPKLSCPNFEEKFFRQKERPLEREPANFHFLYNSLAILFRECHFLFDTQRSRCIFHFARPLFSRFRVPSFRYSRSSSEIIRRTRFAPFRPNTRENGGNFSSESKTDIPLAKSLARYRFYRQSLENKSQKRSKWKRTGTKSASTNVFERFRWLIDFLWSPMRELSNF